MRRHHQEVHMVDDFTIGHILPVVAGGAAELAEHILPVGVATAFLNLRTEIIDQVVTPGNAAPHLCEGQRTTDRRDRCRNHVDKGLVDAVRLGPQRHAKEGVGSNIECQLLDRRIE